MWKNSHNYSQTHPKCKSWECFGKFRIFASMWALRFSKLKKKWLRKRDLNLATTPLKLDRIYSSQCAFLWWLVLNAKLAPCVAWRLKEDIFVSLSWCVYPKDPNVLKSCKDDQWIHIGNREFNLPLEGGLPTLGIIFSVISSLILKISVPMF